MVIKMWQFKEFLEENERDAMGFHPPKKMVLVKDLGNWAFYELSKLEKGSEHIREKRRHEYNLLKNITIACLGETKVKKRLELL